MPSLRIPDPDTRIAQRDGVSVYALDLRDEYPLYRNIKLIGDKPILGGRRSMHLCWIVHEARWRRGGDAWLLAQTLPGLLAWITEATAACFDRSYLLDTFGWTDAECDEAITRERAKYEK